MSFLAALPERYRLILHGRYTCKARLPECWRCPVVDLCAYKAKVLVKRASVRP